MQGTSETNNASTDREELHRCKKDQAFSALCVAMHASAPPEKEYCYSFRVSTGESDRTSLLPPLPPCHG